MWWSESSHGRCKQEWSWQVFSCEMQPENASPEEEGWREPWRKGALGLSAGWQNSITLCLSSEALLSQPWWCLTFLPFWMELLQFILVCPAHCPALPFDFACVKLVLLNIKHTYKRCFIKHGKFAFGFTKRTLFVKVKKV